MAFCLPEDMATAADPFKNLQDELTCCLCLEYFKHPVSINKCSHSFCKECITQYCKKKGTKASCPTCRRSLCQNHLVENRSLANITEIVQQIKESPRAWGWEPGNCQALLELFCRDDQEASRSQNLKLSAGCLLSQLKVCFFSIRTMLANENLSLDGWNIHLQAEQMNERGSWVQRFNF